MKKQVWHQHYDPGVPISLDYPSDPIDRFLRQTAQKTPSKPALIFGGLIPLLGERHLTITYQELDQLVDRFAAGLQHLGLKKGDRASIYMANCPQFVITYYAILRAGGIVVPSNPLYTPREIKHQLNDSGAKFAVVMSLLYDNIKKIRAKTSLNHVIVTNIKEYFPGLLKFLFTLTKEKEGHRVDIAHDSDTHWFQDILKRADTPQPVKLSPDDTAALMYTGGTTGIPKGAQLSYANLVANAIQSVSWLLGSDPGRGNEITLSALPLSHAYAMTVCMNVSVFNGFSQVLIPNPRDLDHLLATINKHHPTLFPGVPALYTAINHHPAVQAGKYNLRSIQSCLSGAAGLPGEVQQEFQRITGGILVEGYGLSESSPVAIGNPFGGGRIGFIGVPMPDTEVKIVDEQANNKALDPNQPGILCLRGPQVMKGYWGMPTETANALRQHPDGKVWLHTGDIAEMMEDGYFRLVDRQKDLILAAGGYNVYPRDIEERLYEHPAVLEVAAIGVPAHSSNQRAKVFVVLKAGQTATGAELIDWCRQGLAPYKVPKYVEFRDELPKTLVGKILRRELVEEESAKTDS